MRQAILAVDATGDGLTTAVTARGRVWELRRAGRPHDESVVPAVDELLRRARLSWPDLRAVAAASGPGRFTGIRIGMAYAAVAAWKLGVPALAVSRLKALAWRAPAGRCCVVLPGWREERYYQLFDRASEQAAPRPAGKPAWVGRAGWVEVASATRGAIVEGDPTARDLLAEAAAQLAVASRPDFAPLYLKPAGYELRS